MRLGATRAPGWISRSVAARPAFGRNVCPRLRSAGTHTGTDSRCVFRCSIGRGVAWPFGRGSQANLCVGSRGLSGAANATTSEKGSRAGTRVTAARQRRVQGPRITISASALALPTAFRESVAPTTQPISGLPPCSITSPGGERKGDAGGLERRVGKSDTGTLARLQPGEGTAFITRQPRVRSRSEACANLGGPRTSRSSASPSGSVSSALASKHGIVVVLSRSGHRLQDVQGPEGSRSPTPRSRGCGRPAVPPTRTGRGGS